MPGGAADRAVARQDEREVRAADRAAAERVLDQEGDVLARLLAAQIDEERAFEPVAAAEAPADRRAAAGSKPSPTTPDGSVADAVELVGQRRLGRRVEDEAPAGLERVADDAEVGERLVVEARDEHRPLRGPGARPGASSRTGKGRSRPGRTRRRAAEVIEQRRAPHRLLRPARFFLRAEPRAAQDPLLEPAVPSRVPRPDREPTDEHALLPARAGPQHVLPREMVAGAGRQHLDRGAGRRGARRVRGRASPRRPPRRGRSGGRRSPAKAEARSTSGAHEAPARAVDRTACRRLHGRRPITA